MRYLPTGWGVLAFGGSQSVESALISGERGGFCPPSVEGEERIEEDRPSSSPRGVVFRIDLVVATRYLPSSIALPGLREREEFLFLQIMVSMQLLHTSRGCGRWAGGGGEAVDSCVMMDKKGRTFIWGGESLGKGDPIVGTSPRPRMDRVWVRALIILHRIDGTHALDLSRLQPSVTNFPNCQHSLIPTTPTISSRIARQ